MSGRFHALLVIVLSMSVAGLSGCALGPTALRVSRTAYNEAVQRTTAEQLLLNLVRLQYREAPLFLEMGNIATQFTFEGGGSIGQTINQNIPREEPTPDVWEWGANVGYREQPTLTFSPLQGDDFVRRLLSPVSLDSMLLLTRSGWRIDRVLRICVQQMNGLDNASNASSPTPQLAPEFEDLARVSEALRDLQKERLLELTTELRYRAVEELPVRTELTQEDVLGAEKAGYVFRPADGGGYVLCKPVYEVVWRIPLDRRSAEVQAAVELLGLDANETEYVVEGQGSSAALVSTMPASKKIRLETRSLLGTLFYLSQGIDVPEAHRRAGVVTTTVRADGEPFDWSDVMGDLLHVRSQRLPPKNAAVAVLYRGYWFYIDDADLSSKSTFALLGQLFALQAGQEALSGPVLTLPIGG
ncbi:MAG: hypothetical protein PVJ57_01000 [Phycisphaerae bacterium]|jgi:hypothetical protein